MAEKPSQDAATLGTTTPTQQVSQPIPSITAPATPSPQPIQPIIPEPVQRELGNKVYIGGIIVLLGIAAIFISFFSDWYPLTFSKAPDYLGPVNITVILVGVILLIIGLVVVMFAFISHKRKAAVEQPIQLEEKTRVQTQPSVQYTPVQQSQVQTQPQTEPRTQTQTSAQSQQQQAQPSQQPFQRESEQPDQTF